MPHGAQPALCDPEAHARAIVEFTTGERIVLSRWWSGLPRLQFARSNRGLEDCIACAEKGDGCLMLSWRAKDAPIFTLAYRGREVLCRISLPAAPVCSTIAVRPPDTRSAGHGPAGGRGGGGAIPHRPVLPQHGGLLRGQAGHTHRARGPGHGGPVHHGGVHAEGGAFPNTIAIWPCACTDDPTSAPKPQGQGYDAERGVDAQGREVCGDDTVLCSSLKVIDVDVGHPMGDAPSARCRAGIMQAIGQRWERAPPLHGADACQQRRRGIMWCGELRRNEALQVLSLRHTLRHTMQSLVILTSDPYLQVLIPVQDAERQLQSGGAGRPQEQHAGCLLQLHPRLLGQHAAALPAVPGPGLMVAVPVLGPLAPGKPQDRPRQQQGRGPAR